MLKMIQKRRRQKRYVCDAHARSDRREFFLHSIEKKNLKNNNNEQTNWIVFAHMRLGSGNP